MRFMRIRLTLAVLALWGLVGCAEPESAQAPEAPRGRYHEWSGDDPNRAAFDAIRSVGYLSGSREIEPGATVTRHDPGRVQAGINFYSSGHAGEAFLMDNEGGELYRWHAGLDRVWPGLSTDVAAAEADFWRRAHVFDDGSVIAIFGGIGILRLDRDSNILWSNANQAHHDLDFDADGTLVTLTRRTRVVPELDLPRPALDDYVTWMDEWGGEIRSLSLIDAFLKSEYAYLLQRRYDDVDILHTNSIQLLDDRHAAVDPVFSKGHALLSWRKIDAIGVLDLSSGVIVKAWTGSFRRQHDPKLLDDGQILFFDNSGLGELSRALQLDPRSGELSWDTSTHCELEFYSDTCGTVERLANGNTLVTESDGGRAIEFAPSGEAVWEFYNPHRAGHFIATLFEVIRLPEDFGEAWISRGVDEPAVPAGDR